jgi:hypothetical protein
VKTSATKAAAVFHSKFLKLCPRNSFKDDRTLQTFAFGRGNLGACVYFCEEISLNYFSFDFT